MIISIQGHPIEIPDPYHPGDPMTPEIINLANRIFITGALLRASTAASLEDAFRISCETTWDNIPVESSTLDEAIDIEARQIATEIIASRLKAQGLPVGDLTLHVDTLIRSKPSVRADALARLKSRAKARDSIFAELGIKRQNP